MELGHSYKCKYLDVLSSLHCSHSLYGQPVLVVMLILCICFDCSNKRAVYHTESHSKKSDAVVGIKII